MNFKTWFPLVLAIVLGLVAMKVARDVLSKKEPAAAGGSATQVVVANRDLAAGAELKAEDLTTMSIAGEVNSQAMFTNITGVTGRVVASAIAKGTPVLETLLAPVGSGAGLQALIPKGMRAITIEINEFSGVAGNLIPGCRVDVVSTINGEGGETTSRTVVQNVKIQAMGVRATQGDPNAPVRSATLLATPDEAEAIELAASTGKPRLVLRNGNDNEAAVTGGMTLAELRNGGTLPLDPFSTEMGPAVQVSAPSPANPPSTQPQTVTEAQPRTQQVAERRPWRPAGRQVKIIRGGIETEVVVEDLAVNAGSRWMTTNAPTEELNENGD